MAASPESSATPPFEFEQLDPAAAALLQPVQTMPDGAVNRAYTAHQFREQRISSLPGLPRIKRTVQDRRDDPDQPELPYLTTEGISETFAGTQIGFETHRLFTPFLQEILHYPDTGAAFLEGIDVSCQRDTDRLLEEAAKNAGQLQCDVAILGTGPHGASAAQTIRELNPSLTIYMVEAGDRPGGQWRSYGPQVSFSMNSRVRRADRRLAPIPRTPASINPLGRYATLELSDITTANYAPNTITGAAVATNARMAADAILVNTGCDTIYDLGSMAELLLKTENGDELTLQASAVVNACGIEQSSTLNPGAAVFIAPGYYQTQDIYRHFGNYDGNRNHRPLQAFAGRLIIGIGGGDSLLTGLDALLGNLPRESYGPYGVGRDRIAQYIWVGAPEVTAAGIDVCLRSKYKNGIVQALPKYNGDLGAIINPLTQRARGVERTSGGFDVRLDDDNVIRGDIVWDHTNQQKTSYGPTIVDLRSDSREGAVVSVGPGANLSLPAETLEVIKQLKIKQNTASLWALMPLTDQAARRAGLIAVRNAFFRGLN